METQEWEKEFDERFPAFFGIGAPFPMFEDTPNRNHIKQFISSLLSQQREQAYEEGRKYGRDQYLTAFSEAQVLKMIETPDRIYRTLRLKTLEEVEAGLPKEHYDIELSSDFHAGYQEALSAFRTLITNLKAK